MVHVATTDQSPGAAPTIGSVRARAVSVPLRRPVIAGIGRFNEWPLVLVDVCLRGGTVGHGYVAPYRAGSVGAVLAEIRDLGSIMAGASAAPHDRFLTEAKALNVVGAGGISLIAIAALDMAIWDALAKEAGKPLAVLLGGTVGPVRAYNSNGLWRHEVSTLSTEAADLAAEGGFSAMKLRLGSERLADDLAAIEAVRQGVGSDIDLMVDFNQTLGLGDAIRRCRDLDPLGLYWLEEPIAYDNVRGYADLASKVRTPLQIGENFYGPRDLFTFLQAGAVHYAMADLMRIGGVTGWMRTAAIADSSGVQLSNHLYPEISAHVLRVTPTAHWLEWVDWALPILRDPIVPGNGHLTASGRPGTDVNWDEAAVAKYEIMPTP
ncbi:enolase C-terminal domain-like protein [Sphingobium yanoikuyae]|uniref:Mandelate racemase n=1 Tax=Sphingobium yanoikuyae TaxID=13690 RepID=A0A291MYJ7_SPHYA|nr:enolase C-terminal domain-like protein [Sphingobium yanoikuyae]ATI79978.1 mandelate racemase [Sphingobium yanoikuyae]